MAESGWLIRSRWIAAGLLWNAWTSAGCTGQKRVEPALIANPSLGRMTIAVAPALNLSGSADFDRDRFADLMASELSYAEGISVIPVNRVLGVLAAQGRSGVESPAHALELVGLLGADAILVFAVTEYDPYAPPSIGLSAQLFGAWPRDGRGEMDPIALSKQATLAAAGGRQAGSRRLLAQTQQVFDASHESVIEDLKAFGQRRAANTSPYGWRLYVVSQQRFIRYCCHATIRMLLSGQDEAGPADLPTTEVRTP